MQGIVWGGLKFSTTMDKLNKYLKYFCMQDTNIPSGVIGMADDTLSISNCGTEAVQTNAVINSFKEEQKFTLPIDQKVLLFMWETLKSVLRGVSSS